MPKPVSLNELYQDHLLVACARRGYGTRVPFGNGFAKWEPDAEATLSVGGVSRVIAVGAWVGIPDALFQEAIEDAERQVYW